MFIPCDCAERERDWGRDTEKKSFRLWIDSLRSIRNYQPLQLRFLLHLNKLSDKCRAQISTVEIVICIIAPIVNALKLKKNPCMCTILNANFSKLSLINSLGGKSNFDKLYWKRVYFRSPCQTHVNGSALSRFTIPKGHFACLRFPQIDFMGAFQL